MYYTTHHHHIQILIIVISNSCHPEMGRLASVALAVSLLLMIQSHLGSSQRDGFFSFLTSFRRPARVRKPQPIIVRASRVHKVSDKVQWFIWFLTRISCVSGSWQSYWGFKPKPSPHCHQTNICSCLHQQQWWPSATTILNKQCHTICKSGKAFHMLNVCIKATIKDILF